MFHNSTADNTNWAIPWNLVGVKVYERKKGYALTFFFIRVNGYETFDNDAFLRLPSARLLIASI
jgi:hypothetical protein